MRILPLLLILSSTLVAGTHDSVGRCTICHFERTASTSASAPKSAICLSCHDGVSAPNHDSLDQELEDALPKEGAYEHVRLAWSLATRGSMEMRDCLRCHDPHRPDRNHLKIETFNCRSCHPDR